MMHALWLSILLPLFIGTAACGGAALLRWRSAPAWIAAAVTLTSLALISSLAPHVFAGQAPQFTLDWMPELGLEVNFRLDGLSLMFAWMITVMGLLIVAYAAFYMQPQDSKPKFYGLLMLFMSAMLGIVLSNNLLLLVIFWELTSLSSFLLVGYWQQEASAREGAKTALTVTGAGGLALLGGVVLLGQIGGTYEISALWSLAPQLQADPRFTPAILLILLGCFTKSAQVPFHFWLPQAMAAPTPVSAYLHSATMVKAGVFLLARLHPALASSDLFETLVISAGLLTMGFTACVAVFKNDIKGLLAYSTLSHLGLLTLLLGLPSDMAVVVAVFHILNHASFKAALFMMAGIVGHETGTRDMRQLYGLARYLPWTASFGALAAAAMAGLPPTNGFLSKEMFFAETVELSASSGVGWMLPVVATLAAVFSVAYSLRLIHAVFFNQSEHVDATPSAPNVQPHEPPWGMRWPMTFLAILCWVVGIFPEWAVGDLVRVAAAAVLNAPAPAFELVLWHGLNLPLLMSLVALIGGGLIYLTLMRVLRLHRFKAVSLSTHHLFQWSIQSLFKTASKLTAILENGSLQRFIAWMIASVILIAAFSMAQVPALSLSTGTAAPLLAWVVWALLIVTCAFVLKHYHQRFLSVILVSAVGVVSSLTFLGLSAPDLALTQLCVDIATTVLMLMSLALLPQQSPKERAPVTRLWHGALAVAFGVGVAWAMWMVMVSPHETISWYFVENALHKGGGSNIVNVILVDFRGYDTMGEITVLAIASVGVLALMQGLQVKKRTHDPDGRTWSFAQPPLMLRVVSRVVLPMALLLSVYIYWRGHNLPGGGFIAGLITASALVLQYMAWGQDRAELLLYSRSGRRFTRWVATGLLIAGGTGISAWFWHQPFLTSAFGHPVLPWLGELSLASAAVFDLGVYITVVGSTLLTLAVLGGVCKPPPPLLNQNNEAMAS
jgi:multicomponent K+:H+ antiporter subunit A